MPLRPCQSVRLRRRPAAGPCPRPHWRPYPADFAPPQLLRLVQQCEAEGFGPAISCEDLLRELGLLDGEES